MVKSFTYWLTQINENTPPPDEIKSVEFEIVISKTSQNKNVSKRKTLAENSTNLKPQENSTMGKSYVHLAVNFYEKEPNENCVFFSPLSAQFFTHKNLQNV